MLLLLLPLAPLPLLLLLQIISTSLPLIPDSYGTNLAAATSLGGLMAPDGANAIAKIAGVIR